MCSFTFVIYRIKGSDSNPSNHFVLTVTILKFTELELTDRKLLLTRQVTDSPPNTAAGSRQSDPLISPACWCLRPQGFCLRQQRVHLRKKGSTSVRRGSSSCPYLLSQTGLTSHEMKTLSWHPKTKNIKTGRKLNDTDFIEKLSPSAERWRRLKWAWLWKRTGQGCDANKLTTLA